MKQLFVALFTVLLFIFARSAEAEVFFYDTFSKNLDKWSLGFGNNESSWIVREGVLDGNVNPGYFHSIYAKWNEDLLVGDYKVEATVINKSGVDQTFYVRVSNNKMNYYQVGYRYNESRYPIDNNNITLYKFINGLPTTGDAIAIYPAVGIPRTFNLEQNVSHKIKILLSGINIKVYFDGVLVINYFDRSANPILNGGVGILNWSGACPVATRNLYDDFIVSSLDDPGIIPPQKHKIIFIPGMGASWNTKALVYNDTVPDNEWKMTPFVNNYDNLINSFEKNGLVKGSDFYVWNYDWRKPLGESVGKLSSFISSSVASNETVDLIGHSMGGMIARLWAQDNVNDQRLGKIISLGSPQHGAVDAYSVWESAQIAERIDPASVALSIMIGLQQRGGESRVQTLRNYSPSFKDLLPTFNFAKSGGLIKDVEEMSTVNDYLLSKNLSSPSIFDKYLAVVGQGSLTKEWVNLGDRDYLDKYLGQWSDGKVISYDYSDDGDGTVLIKSGQFVGDTMVVKLSNHGNLVNNSLSLILNELDIGDSLVVDTGESNLSGKLIFLIASPARMDVICDDGFTTTNDEHGLISFDSLGKNECQLTITGFADGTYHLVTGKIGEKNSYRYWENSIISGGIHRMLINPTDGEPILGANDDYWYGLLKLKSNQLLDLFNEDKDLVMAIKFIESRDIAKFMGKFFSFWKNHHEMIVSNQIIDIIREILISNQHQVNKGVAKKYWREIELRTERFSKFVDKADKNQGITNFEIGIYQKVSDLLDDGKQKLNNENYDNVWADIVLVKELLKQINN